MSKHDLMAIPITGKMLSSHTGEKDDSFFLVGAENYLVERAVTWAVEGKATSDEALPDMIDTSMVPHCPIIFYGPSGCGKTHLAEGIFKAWRQKKRKKKGTFLTGDDFARALATALASKTMDEFRAGIRDVEMLVIDRVDFLKGKEAAQSEFLISLDHILSQGHTVVLTMSQFPSSQYFFDERLVARLISGLLVPVSLPGLATRLALLERFARQLHLRLTVGALQALAKGFPVSVPQIFGTLSQLALEAGKTTIDVDLARQIIRDREKTSSLTIDVIARLTAKQMGIKLADLKGKTRTAMTTKVRGIAIYLMRQLTGASLKEIGGYFGGRDHTTIAHSATETESRMTIDHELRNSVLKIRDLLQQQ